MNPDDELDDRQMFRLMGLSLAVIWVGSRPHFSLKRTFDVAKIKRTGQVPVSFRRQAFSTFTGKMHVGNGVSWWATMGATIGEVGLPIKLRPSVLLSLCGGHCLRTTTTTGG